MHFMHEFTRETPFDLFELHLIHLVAKLGSFTQAGAAAGLSQSAMTRQIQGVEERLGMPLFERTTRRVALTEAGAYLLRQTAHVLGDIDASVRRLKEEFANTPKIVRTAVSRTVSLAYLPGFFVANRRRHPEVEITVAHESSHLILEKLEANALDAGVVSPPSQIPPGLEISHRFRDEFVLITPTGMEPPPGRRSAAQWPKWAVRQHWLLIEQGSQTGRQLAAWIKKQRWKIRPGMEMDNFDSLINLVALGMGASLVPHRALAIYARRKGFRRYATPVRFSRELVVLTRSSPHPPEHVQNFVKAILF